MFKRILQRIAIVTLLAAGPAGAASADQNAGNLDKLFQELAKAEHAMTAQQLEREIWRAWLDTDDEAVEEELKAGMRDMSGSQFEESIEHFTRVTEMAPKFAEGWNKRATAYFYNGDLARSMRDIQKVLSLEPRHFGAISGMGLIFLERGDERAALDAFRQVLEIHPQSQSANQYVDRLSDKLDGPGI